MINKNENSSIMSKTKYVMQIFLLLSLSEILKFYQNISVGCDAFLTTSLVPR